MTAYTPPINNMQFILQDLLGFSHDELDKETITAILEEAGKLATDVLAPLNKTGDEHGAKLENGTVTSAPGFKDAYTDYRQGGWNAVPFPESHGGQNLPWALAFPIQEMWQAANMSFGLCPLLNQGAVEAIHAHGSQEQKDEYLPKLISGEWTGTMNLTEPQAGSDLGLIRSKAEKQDNGAYKISGQKIYITYGEHDFTDNIIHLVLARTPDAPEDVKGISLFIVPKILNDGTRNSVQCIGLEHKLGIHASPTCTMEFDGATGYLIGEENQGLKYMFTMMNNARLSVGLQGVAIAERATQAAQHYASERIQGKAFSGSDRVSINNHADVKRMLLTMEALTMAGRALTYEAATALDNEHEHTEDQSIVDILTPIVKSWCTDMAVEVASLGVQIHGGMGFIEETGAAQYYRDARILPIYEGTNGIQALDLVFRKIIRDNGVVAGQYMAHMKQRTLGEHQDQFGELFQKLENTTAFINDAAQNENYDLSAAAAGPYLKAFGTIACGALMSDLYTKGQTSKQKQVASFFIFNILPTAQAYLQIAVEGSRFVKA